jgi:hypothetical protein
MSSLKNEKTKLKVIKLQARGHTQKYIADAVGIPQNTLSDFLTGTKTHTGWWDKFKGVGNIKSLDKLQKKVSKAEHVGAKILTLDIETAPIKATVWGIWQQNVPVSRINTDWYIIAWAAKWLHDDEVYYEDKRESWETEDDLALLQHIWKLLDEADIIITQNGKKFDAKRLNTRFLMHGMKPPSSYRHIDTLQEAKRWFNFTSNKLEFMTDKLCKVYKKLKHGNYAGNLLWDACLTGDMKAWDEMEIYNIHDVLSLEELYHIMQPWMKSHPNLNLYTKDDTLRCSCGGEEFTHNGYHYTNLSKFDRFSCNSCGAENRGRVNLLSKQKRATLRMNVLV